MKSPLIIPIEQLHKAPLHLELELTPEELDLADPEYDFIGPARLDITFKMIVNDIMAEGSLAVTARTPCVRCLAPTETRLNVKVQETWFHETEEQREEEDATAEAPLVIRTYEGEELDVAEDLRELIMAELPDRVYCAPDCRGLCAGCGANLNVEPCHCAGGDTGKPEGKPEPEWKKALRSIKLN